MNCILNDIATCNFYFGDFVSTLMFIQIIVVKCDYVQKRVQMNHAWLVFMEIHTVQYIWIEWNLVNTWEIQV